MRAAGVNRMLFSSTCATYGMSDRVPMTEDTPQAPFSPYAPHQAHRRMDDPRLCPCLWAGLHASALLQRLGGGSFGRVRRVPRPRDASDPARARGRARPAREDPHLRRPTIPRPTAPASATTSTSTILPRPISSPSRPRRPRRPRSSTWAPGQGQSVMEIIAACEKVTGRTIAQRDRAAPPRRPAGARGGPDQAQDPARLGAALSPRSRTRSPPPGPGTRRTPTATRARAMAQRALRGAFRPPSRSGRL
jgi:UDP-glucose 4-epimerase